MSMKTVSIERGSIGSSDIMLASDPADLLTSGAGNGLPGGMIGHNAVFSSTSLAETG
jgi:hypothetical protein